MKQNESRINAKPIDKIYALIDSDDFFRLANTKVEQNESLSYHDWNKLCTAIIRIEDTIDYANRFNPLRENLCKEAFDFYELLNCFSIILGCVTCIFEEFKLKIDKEYSQKKAFLRSNKSDSPDIAFFKFIRSACAVHPEKTTAYKKITGTQGEYYPYAVWNNRPFYAITSNFPKDCDVILTAWNSDKPNSDREYYLYLDEFYNFVNGVVACLLKLVSVIEKCIENYKATRVCSNLKNPSEFVEKSEYCLYLRDELLHKKADTVDSFDGGLLVAAHLLSNDLISSDFKNAIFDNVLSINEQMTADIDEIGLNDIYISFMDLSEVQNKLDTKIWFCALKEAEFLEREARREIERNQTFPFKDSSGMFYERTFADACLAANKITAVKGLFDDDSMNKAKSFPDLFELLLQSVWEKKELIKKERGL